MKTKTLSKSAKIDEVLYSIVRSSGREGISVEELARRLNKRFPSENMNTSSLGGRLGKITKLSSKQERRKLPEGGTKEVTLVYTAQFAPDGAQPYKGHKKGSRSTEKKAYVERDPVTRVSMRPKIERHITDLGKARELVRQRLEEHRHLDDKWFTSNDFEAWLAQAGLLGAAGKLGIGDYAGLIRHQGFERQGTSGAFEYRLPPVQDDANQPQKMKAETKIKNLDRTRQYLRDYLGTVGGSSSWKDVDWALMLDGFITSWPLSQQDRKALTENNGIMVEGDKLVLADEGDWIEKRFKSSGDGLGRKSDLSDDVDLGQELSGLARVSVTLSHMTVRELVPGERILFEVEEGESAAFFDKEGEKRVQHWPGKGKIIFVPASVLVIVVLLAQLF